MSSNPMAAPIRPDELYRRISEIDLTNLRRRTDTITSPPDLGTPQSFDDTVPAPSAAGNYRYTPQQLLAYAPEGLKSPPDGQKPPPPTPLEFPDTPPATSDEQGGITSDQQSPPQDVAEPEVKKKKKKKKSGGGGGGKAKKTVTGFEEFYADPPTTPDEAAEEADLYATSIPLPSRMEECLKRYRKRRNLDSVKANILTKYLMLGGVEASTTKSFTGGLDKDTLETATADEIAAIQATDSIRSGSTNIKYYDPSKPDDWVVDFTGVAKGFLSWTAPRRLGMDNEQIIKTTCSVISNFLNYLLVHAVCPEYTEDILAARAVCVKAEDELWKITCLREVLPGDFNIAASTLHEGGAYYDVFKAEQEWAKVDPHAQDDDAIGMDTVRAELVYKTALSIAGTTELYLKEMKLESKIVKTEIKNYEVVSITMPTITEIDQYARVTDLNHGPLKPLGSIKVKAWIGPGIDIEDTSDDEDDESSGGVSVEDALQTFWAEGEILQYLYEGLKLELLVRELSTGLKFFDRVAGLYCSFYTILPNEKMMDNWKEPVPNTRPPPTEEDPEADERAQMDMDGKEIEGIDKDFGEKTDKKSADKPAEKPETTQTENVNIGVGIKVKPPKAPKQENKPSSRAQATFYVGGEMEDDGNGVLHPVGNKKK